MKTKPSPKDSNERFQGMRAAYESARFRDAAEAFDAAPLSSAEARVLRARVFLKQRNPAGAVEMLRAVAGADKATSAEIEMLLGTAESRVGNFEAADRHFAKAARAVSGPRDRGLTAEIAYHRARRHIDAAEPALARAELLSARAAMGGERSTDLLFLETFILSAERRYRDQAALLVELLNSIDPFATNQTETRALATHSLAGLVRELYIPDAVPVVTRHLAGAPWPDDFAANRFQTVKALGWWHALQGDYLNAFRMLKQSARDVTNDAWRAIAAADRAYLAKCIGELRWSRHELDEAEIYAQRADWESTQREERVALLLLAELFAQFDPGKSAYYLTRFRGLGELKSPLLLFRNDPRLGALTDYSAGVAELALGEKREGIRLLRAAFGVFGDIGYNWRAARCLLRICEVRPDDATLAAAREKIIDYPNSWLAAEIRALSPERQQVEIAGLLPSQQRVAELLCRGLSAKEIADTLGRSEFTVRNHTRDIFKVFGVGSRAAFMAEAGRRGLL